MAPVPAPACHRVEVDDDLLTAAEVADLIGVEVQTLRNWKAQGRGPASFHIGSRLRYRRSKLAAWIAEQEQASQTEAS